MQKTLSNQPTPSLKVTRPVGAVLPRRASPPPPAAAQALRPTASRTGLAKFAIAVASVAMTLGGWAFFAANEPATANNSAAAAAPDQPIAAVTRVARSATQARLASVATIAPNAPVTPFANTDAVAQSQTIKPQTQLRVVTVPMPQPRRRMIAITRSSQ